VVLAIVAVVLPAQAAWNSFISLGYVVAYVANWARASGNLSGAVAHCWSLSIEEQFYIVWPLALILLLRTRSQRVVLTVVALVTAAVVFHRIAGNSASQSDLGTDVRADALLVGCLLALAFAWLGASKWPWSRLAVLGVPLLAGEVLRPRDLRGYGYTVIALLFACLVAAAASTPAAERLPTVNPLRALGRISYALYLWHYPVLYWLRGGSDASISHATVANAVLGLVVSLVLATASYLVVERRFIRRRVPQFGHEQMFD
jgi:peptidoglycan/LPS O-acetylase OafA/YrhL